MAIRILSSENITGSFEVSGKVGIGTAPTSRNLSVFRSTAGSVANFLHYTDASNFAGLYIGVSQSSQTVSLNASGSSGGNLEMQCGNATALSLTSSNATFSGEILNRMAAPKIRLEPSTQNNASILELGVLNGGTNAYARIDAINLQNFDTNLRFWTNAPGSTTQTLALTLDSSQNATFEGQVSVGSYAIPSDHQFQIAHLGQSYARFALTNSQTGNGSSDGLIFQMENLNSIIKNQENGSLAFGTNGRETDLYINSSGSINIGSRRAALPSTFGYSSSYKVLILGSSGANYTTDAVTLSLGVDVSGNPSGSYNGNGREIIIRNEGAFISPNAANNGYNSILSWNSSGQPYFSQNVGIGVTSPGEKLQVQLGNIKIDGGVNSNERGLIIAHAGLTGNQTRLVQDSSASIGHLYTTERGLRIQAGKDGSASGGNLDFYTNQTAKYRITITGGHQWTTDGSFSTSFTYSFRDAVGINNPNSVSAQAVAGYVMSVGRSSDSSTSVSGGIISQGESHFVRGVSFGSSGQDQILNYYKTDTWAPQIYYQNATDQANATNSTQTGIYTKIGNVCTVQFRLIWTQASGTPAVDNIGIKNLPFGGNATQAYAEVPCSLIGYTGGPSPRGNLTLTLPGANQTLAIFNDTNNVGNMGNAIGSGTKEIRFSFTYLTN